MDYAISVGSNRGDRAATIARAAALLCAAGDITLLRAAPLLTTQPQGGPSGQGEFLNTAWIVRTALGPHQVLYALQRVENACGRTRTQHWGARTLDLDLLLSNPAQVICTPVLKLPHPRLAQRDFVLIPLQTIAPDWRHPLLDETVVVMAKNLGCVGA